MNPKPRRSDEFTLDGFFRIPADDPHIPEFIEELKIKTREGKEFELYEYNEDMNELCLPRHFSDREAYYGRRVLDLRSNGRQIAPERLKSLFVPRDGQEEAVSSVMSRLRSENGSLLIAQCGTGKTVMGAELSLRLGLSTCILVHKEFLAKQWEDAFRMLAPNVTIGRMQRDVVDTGQTHDVVIAVTQSVVNPRRDYPLDFYSSFGLIICDEVHRYGASLWQTAITKFPARYRVGLTATPERRDGLWKVIASHISPSGPVLQADSLKPDIYLVKTDVQIQSEVWNRPWFDDKARRAKLVSAIAAHSGRNTVVSKYIIRAYRSGRKILVISERRDQLNELFIRLKAEAIPEDDIGFYVGGMKQAKLDASAEKAIILTTYQMSTEGLNIPDLDTLIMATPQSSIQQTVGRILRAYEGKGSPIVIDIVDAAVTHIEKLEDGTENVEAPLLQIGEHRRRQYRKLGYNVHG